MNAIPFLGSAEVELPPVARIDDELAENLDREVEVGEQEEFPGNPGPPPDCSTAKDLCLLVQVLQEFYVQATRSA